MPVNRPARPGPRTYFVPPPSVVAATSGHGSMPVPAHPRSRKPPNARPPGVQPGEIVVSSTRRDEPFVTVTPAMFGSTANARNTMTVEDAWNSLVGRAGIDSLGVPTTWWPGMNPDLTPAHVEGGKMQVLGHAFRPESWAASATDFTFTNPDTGETLRRSVRYDVTRAAQQYMAMGAKERAKFSQLMADSGLLPEEYGGIGDYDIETSNAFAKALSLANYYGKSVEATLREQAALFSKVDGGGGGGGGGAGPVVKIEIPDYKTMVQESKNMIRQNLGRDPEDWEMTLVADEMKRQYGKWAGATKARMVGGNGTYEIPDPKTLTQAFIEDTYANEISRLEDVGDFSQTNRLLIGAATMGTNMMGGPVQSG